MDCLKVERRVFKHMLHYNLCAYLTFYYKRKNEV